MLFGLQARTYKVEAITETTSTKQFGMKQVGYISLFTLKHLSIVDTFRRTEFQEDDISTTRKSELGLLVATTACCVGN